MLQIIKIFSLNHQNKKRSVCEISVPLWHTYKYGQGSIENVSIRLDLVEEFEVI